MSVSRYAEALARALELPQEEVERIKLGALVHDVGKIGIPESVLKKPDKLLDDEWEIMKQHPVNMITMDTKYSPINQARKAFVTYSNVKILKAKPLNIYNLAII